MSKIGDWKNVSKKRALEIIGRTYYKTAPIIKLMKDGQVINTMFSLYRIKDGKYQCEEK